MINSNFHVRTTQDGQYMIRMNNYIHTSKHERKFGRRTDDVRTNSNIYGHGHLLGETVQMGLKIIWYIFYIQVSRNYSIYGTVIPYMAQTEKDFTTSRTLYFTFIFYTVGTCNEPEHWSFSFLAKISNS